MAAGWNRLGAEIDGRHAYALQGTLFNDGDRALETVKLVLELGADVNTTNDVGDTALHAAAGKGYDAIVQLLSDKGAQLEVKNKRGRTPLASAKKSTRICCANWVRKNSHQLNNGPPSLSEEGKVVFRRRRF